ncbi:PIG-P-domain-containing protein [Lipomyces oligophaga]|uniref:PIG-P-domain-containing protein n=1 Tax=Lipomyces oligophaga TaxID=45792 RepID=UPI0034CFFE0B
MMKRSKSAASSLNLESMKDNLRQFQPPFYNHPPTPLKPANNAFSLFTSGRSSPRISLTRSTSTVSDSETDIPAGDKLAKQSDVTVGGDAVPPEREYFGFALYVSSTIAFLLYIVWAILPQSVLHSLKIYYYPSRWWALAVPAFLVMFIVYIYAALLTYNTEMLTSDLNQLCTITDEYAVVSDDDSYLWKGSDGVWDIPLESVNFVLYAPRQRAGELSLNGRSETR